MILLTHGCEWWHRMAVQRKNVYRRLPLKHVGAENCISDNTILRAHDRSLPLMMKMFFSNNYGSVASQTLKLR
jgi:hypothetical protein